MPNISSLAAVGNYLGVVAREMFRGGRNVCRRMARAAFEPEVIRNGDIALIAKHPAISAEMRKILYFNRYEVAELEILGRTLEPADRVLEVGGGIGFLSSYLAQVCGSANVTVVEANPALGPIIRRNHELNGVAPRLISAVATCEDRETATLFLAKDFWATSTMNRGGKTVDAPTVNLNRLIEELKPTYLIIDIEGTEVEVAPDLRLDGVEKLLVELHPYFTGNDKANEVVQQFVRVGFLIDFTRSAKNQVYLTRANTRAAAANTLPRPPTSSSAKRAQS